MAIRGTPAFHLNEPKLIIDGFNELIADFLSQSYFWIQYILGSETV